MADRYNAAGIVVTDQAVTIAGRSTTLDQILRAEAYQVEDIPRNLLIFAIGCLAPIAAMIVATQLFLVPQPLDDGHIYWFGPLVLVIVVLCGLLAAAIGKFWPKPWGVVVERPEFGFGKLVRTGDKNQAEQIAAAINAAKGY
jgi:Family of unknown function (DUF6232)